MRQRPSGMHWRFALDRFKIRDRPASLDLMGVRCNAPHIQNGFGEDIYSCGDAIGKFLKFIFDNKVADSMEVNLIEYQSAPEYQPETTTDAE